ncbi:MULTISPECIES: PaaI family thioesterase [unclassified Duganella]|uniref:PaaI family thioesterase n=1 Tax=unclassified Duganella TaxID=2636909 RepID=UPI000E347BCD|nr:MULTISPECIES: PaaI family thioesterase [unclassified Duganella]RFP09942.1 PaaI family thioesterase [Duganella sp. BJB475]RFP25755.1 PaaI family thioesterase [Duganella sp. BJB476]
MMNEAPRMSVDQLNTVLAQSAFLAPYGFSVRSCEEKQCTLIVPFSASLERPGGIVSGMTIMGAADVAMWLAIMGERGTQEQWVTTDMKTAFLRSARQENVVCVARILKLGKRTVYGTAECSNEQGQLLAHHVISYARIFE